MWIEKKRFGSFRAPGLGWFSWRHEGHAICFVFLLFQLACFGGATGTGAGNDAGCKILCVFLRWCILELHVKLLAYKWSVTYGNAKKHIAFAIGSMAPPGHKASPGESPSIRGPRMLSRRRLLSVLRLTRVAERRRVQNRRETTYRRKCTHCFRCLAGP